MPSLSQGERHRNTQASPLPRMVRGKTGDSRVPRKVGTKSENVKERVEVAKVCCHPSSPVKANGVEATSV